MKIVPESKIVNNHIKMFLDDPRWPEHIDNPQLKQIKRCTSLKIQLYLELFK